MTTFRSRSLRWMVPVSAVAAALVGWLSHSGVVAVIVGLLWLAGAVQAWRVRVEADTDGLRLVNPWRSVRLSWEQVESVDLDESRSLAVVGLRSGELISAWGLTALGRRRGGAWVEEGIERLEALRAAAPRAPRGKARRFDEEAFGRRLEAQVRRSPAPGAFIIAALVGGIFAVVLGVVGVVQQYGFLRHGVAVTGEVVAVHPGRSTWDVTVRYPVDGQERTSELDGALSSRPAVGASLPVVYDATHPGWVTGRGDAGTASGFFPKVLVLTLGAGALVYGTGAWARRRRSRPWTPAAALAAAGSTGEGRPTAQLPKGRPTPRRRRRPR